MSCVAESVISCGYSPVFSRMQDNRVFGAQKKKFSSAKALYNRVSCVECVWFWGEGESSLCEKGTCTAFKRIQDPAVSEKMKKKRVRKSSRSTVIVD